VTRADFTAAFVDAVQCRLVRSVATFAVLAGWCIAVATLAAMVALRVRYGAM
jgi:hypothetical protein